MREILALAKWDFLKEERQQECECHERHGKQECVVDGMRHRGQDVILDIRGQRRDVVDR